jgi:hypothetical protein
MYERYNSNSRLLTYIYLLINPKKKKTGKQLNTQSNDDQPQTIFAPVEQPVAVSKEMILEPEIETKAKPELSENQALQPSYFSGHNNIVVRERTIKLPETHIFTPIKGTNTIAREVVSRDESPGTIVVKEYHDVEYSLEPKKKLDQEFEFDDFQSAAPIEPINVKADPVLPLPVSILEPKKVESHKTEISWPDPGDVATSSIVDDLDFLGTSTVSDSSNKIEELSEGMRAIENLGKLELNNENIIGIKKDKVEESILRDEISKDLSVDVLNFVNNSHKVESNLPKNPTTSNVPEDDDFSDFQSHSVAKSSNSKNHQPLNPITLSPAKLVNNTHQGTSWLNSFDDDEVSRIEEAFPKCKKVQKKANEDDDWSDFVSVNQPAPSISSNIANNKTVNGDDWSDFVSVPVKQQQQQQQFAPRATTNFPSKPNFAAWNQPISKPYNVHHATSFLSSEPRNSSAYQYTSSNYPFVNEKVGSRPSMNITSNFNYPFNAPAPNGISTILPDLGFAIPKNLINLPRSGSANDASKK